LTYYQKTLKWNLEDKKIWSIFIFKIWKKVDLFYERYHYEEFITLQPWNEWVNVPKNYIIDYNHRILYQILCEKSCGYILVVHLTSGSWCDNKKNDIVFLL
jgi:hypothetical protein